MRHLTIVVTFVVALLCIAGCSGNVGLSGRVSFPDGSPLTVGEVYFETDTFLAHGSIGKDGRYVLGSLGEKDGLPPGTYRVSIVGAMEGESRETARYLIDEKYKDGRTSGLTCTVSGSTTFDITVTKPEVKKK
ncbi:MAG: hypothetical protein LBG58_01235 [Planctomycetaceae bacterium]|jgi:hypothetical protein|nr:hypothetical protein [Planctomycetaceae bacterium]